MTHTVEDELRAALRSRAETFTADPAAMNLLQRRIRRNRRRTVVKIAVPAAAAVAAAGLVVVPNALGPDGPVAGHPSGSPTATWDRRLPRDLDSRYRPTGPVMRVTPAQHGYGKPVLMWPAAGGLVCWRQDKGGGGCGPARGGRHGFPAGVFHSPSQGGASQPVRDPYVYYGAADDEVAAVSLISADGRSFPGTVVARSGARWRLWQVGVPTSDGPYDDWMRATLIFYNAEGKELERIPRPRLGPEQLPAPQTTGVPLFTYHSDSEYIDANSTTPSRVPAGRRTLYARADGDLASFTSPDVSGWSPSLWPGRRALGVPQYDTQVFGAPWRYGFARRDVAKVIYRLADGRTVRARLVNVGTVRAYSLLLPNDRNGKHGQNGDLIIAYSASGNELGRR